MNANSSTSLSLTQKGKEEVEHRVYKLDIKKRSVLILLDRPHSIQEVLHRTVFPEEEIVEVIQLLVRDGFIDISREGEQSPQTAPPQPAPAAQPQPSVSSGNLHLDGEIILSEAKFLLVDFCVDSFGTESQAFADLIRACKNVKDLDSYLKQIFATAQSKCPDRLPLLVRLVKEINETA